MKIGIMTFHRAYNCGAMLQAWALKTVLCKMGHSVVFPLSNRVGESQRWTKFDASGLKGLRLLKRFLGWLVVNICSIGAEGVSQSRYKKFRKKNIQELDVPVCLLDKYLDLLVFGSDQIWRPELMTEDEQKVFFAESTPQGIQKIAYAASYDDKPLKGESSRRLGRTVLRFLRVSVRERLMAEQIRVETGLSCPVVLDPTLLLEASDYRGIMAHNHPKGEYLFVYTLYTTPYVMHIARYVADRLKLKVVIAPVYKFTRYKAPKGLTYGTSPDRLLSYLAHAKYVMSYSFHGTVFSLIFGKQFLDLRNDIDMFETRSGCLLRQLGLSQRSVNPSIPDEEVINRLTKPLNVDYLARLEDLRRESLDWLNVAVDVASKSMR